MREIKFRGWDSESQEMLPTQDLTQSSEYWGWLGKKDVILMQYTGLKDKNGREIYEGDILSFNGNMTADNSIGLDPNGFMYDESDKYQVIWHPDRAAFDLDYSGLDELPHWKYRRDTWGLMLGGNCEIIGNIYETPKLLK